MNYVLCEPKAICFAYEYLRIFDKYELILLFEE